MRLDQIIKQKPYEKIVRIIRRHGATFVPTIVLYAVLALVPAAMYFILDQTIPGMFDAAYPRALVLMVFSVYELSVALFFYASFLMYYLDMVVVTNDRLIEISQINLFSRSISEMDLYKVQDATSEVHGVIASMFNYGTLTIQTAGEQKQFVFEDIPGPHQLRQELMHLAEEDRKFHVNAPAKTEHHTEHVQ